MSIRQPVSFAASRTFWPFLPMASDSCLSSTTTSITRSPSSTIETRCTLAGLSALRHEGHRILRVLDDVDLLAAKLADDRLHARALHADAGAYRIHVALARVDRDLRTVARFAHGAANHHRAVVDLGHLLLEELDEERGVGAREHDLRSLGAAC